MKIAFILLIVLILATVIYAESTFNELTVGHADQRYCRLFHICRISLVYAEMWFHDDAGKLFTFTAPDTYYTQNVTGTSNTDGFIFIPNSTLQAQYDGLYKVSFSASGSGTANHVYHAGIQVNNTVQYNIETHFKISTGTDIITMSGGGFINLNAGDNVTLAFEDTTLASTGTIYSINVNLVRVGESR